MKRVGRKSQLGALLAILHCTAAFAYFQRETLPQLAKRLLAEGRTTYEISSSVLYPVPKTIEDLIEQSVAVVLASMEDYRYRLTEDRSRIETVVSFRVQQIYKGFGLRAEMERWRGMYNPEFLVPGTKDFRVDRGQEIIVVRNEGMLRINGVLFNYTLTGYPQFWSGRSYILCNCIAGQGLSLSRS